MEDLRCKRSTALKKLFVHMKGYIKECILGPLLKLMEATLELFVPLVIAGMIDTGIANGDPAYIWRMGLLLAALGFAGLLFSVTAQYFAARAAVGLVARIKHALFAHLQKLSYTELDKLGSSTMITRMTSDTAQLQNGVNLALRLLLRSPFVVFGAMIMAFTIDVRAALIFAAAIPILCVIVFGIMLISIPLYKKVQSALDLVTKATRENLSGVRVLRAFCREESEITDFRRKNEALTREQKFVGRISALMNPLTYIVINLAIVWLIHTGALRVEAGLITQGAVIALYNYMSQILVELIKMANLIISMTKAAACADLPFAVFAGG
jgi:ABC-type multidrug transport system fused ATPase/permease subunit